MKVKYSLLNLIKSGDFALFTDEEIARKLRLGRRESGAVHDMLEALCREGELLKDSRGRYGTAEQFGAKRGGFSGNARGFGFFLPDDGGEELFIPRRASGGALHGDTVLACRTEGRSEDEGEILAVLKRNTLTVTGTYRRREGEGYLVPDERKFPAEIPVPVGKNRGLKGGEKALAALSFRGSAVFGEIKEVFGLSGDLLAEERAVIRGKGLKTEFDGETAREASLVRSPTARDFHGREDLRGACVVTIDGEDTRDIDDAISLSEGDGIFRLGVHIADVSHYVGRNTALDREAFSRGTSVYFPDRVLPMLPKELSNGVCSLNEGEDKLALSCLMEIDGRGKVVSYRVAESVIRSRRRMTYREADALMEGDPKAAERFSDLIELFSSAAKLTKILKSARKRRGGVELGAGEPKITLTNGTIEVSAEKQTLAHEMIEQFMVLCNETVAGFLTSKGAPCVYRTHEPPSEEKASSLSVFLAELGIDARFTCPVSPKAYAAVLDGLKDSPLLPVVSRMMLRSMMKARYSAENIGHFGLASKCYCHFTSPIRRYPDLFVHRVVKEVLHGKDAKGYATAAKDAASRSSEQELKAAEAERETDDLYLCAYMRERIGESFEGVISGAASFGLFAELENTVEGLIPVETLPSDYYEFREETQTLKGLHHVYRTGDRVLVRSVGVDWGAKRVQFELLETYGRRPKEKV